MDIVIGNKVIACKDTLKADLEDIEVSPAKDKLILLLRQAATANAVYVRQMVNDGKYDMARFEEGFTQAIEGIADMLDAGFGETTEK